MKSTTVLAALIFSLFIITASAQEPPKPSEGDFIVHDFHFESGESLPEVKLHYATYGKPATDAHGHVTNAVMLLHGTTGSGQQFTGARFAGVLFGPGQLLDASRYFIILPDSIGHGHSPSPATASTPTFRTTITTIWSPHSISFSPKV